MEEEKEEKANKWSLPRTILFGGRVMAGADMISPTLVDD